MVGLKKTSLNLLNVHKNGDIKVRFSNNFKNVNLLQFH
jgi:hypothetical protein